MKQKIFYSVLAFVTISIMVTFAIYNYNEYIQEQKIQCYCESYNQLSQLVTDNFIEGLTDTEIQELRCYQLSIFYNYSMGYYSDFIYRVHQYFELVRQLIIKKYGRLS